MHVIYRVVAGTPPWVFALLAYFVWQGVRSLRPRTVSAWRVLIVPSVFVVLGLSHIVLGRETGIGPYLAWAAGAVLAAPLALATGPRIVAVDRGRGMVTRPGSPVPLVRNVAVFALQYVVAVTAAMHLSAYAELAILGHVVSGAEAGYFATWAALFVKRYRAEPVPAAGEVARSGLASARSRGA